MFNIEIGDALEIQDGKKTLILHCCNDEGKWGAGFVIPLGKEFPKSEQEYRSVDPEEWEVGDVQYVDVADNVVVANLIGQHGIARDANGRSPVRYNAFKEGMDDVQEYALNNGIEVVQMPALGCGLAGGDLLEITKIILKHLVNDKYETVMYIHPKDF